MLTQYQLTLAPDRPCRLRPELGYRLYAALLELAPPDFGAAAHQEGVTPVSQFLSRGGGRTVWTVSLLGEEAEDSLAEPLERSGSFVLDKDRVSMGVTGRSCRRIADTDQLLALAAAHSGFHHLRFETATAFKSRGQYLNLPTARLMVQSLIKKWNGCITGCPIEDEDGQGMEALAAGLRCREFRLRDRMYYLKGQSIPGFTGSMTLENRLSGFHRQLADALLIFAEYAGVGIKTALGMGGVLRQ